jgi:hypothetical protein
METWGAFAFGTVLGWFLYFTNRYRKGDTQLSDVATLIGVIGGGATTALFGDAKTTLFGAYGLGVAVGFFAYFITLVFMVRNSGGVFTLTWFLDGRRKVLKDDEIIPEGTRSTGAAMDMRAGPVAANASAAPAVAEVQTTLEVVAERDAAIGTTNDALREIRQHLDNETDQAERDKLFQMEDQLTDKLEELVVLRIRAALDSQQVKEALAKLRAITDEMKANAAQMKNTADALAQAAKIIGLASKVIGIVGALA